MRHYLGTRGPNLVRPAWVQPKNSRLGVKRAGGSSLGNECVLLRAQPVDKEVKRSSLG